MNSQHNPLTAQRPPRESERGRGRRTENRNVILPEYDNAVAAAIFQIPSFILAIKWPAILSTAVQFIAHSRPSWRWTLRSWPTQDCENSAVKLKRFWRTLFNPLHNPYLIRPSRLLARNVSHLLNRDLMKSRRVSMVRDERFDFPRGVRYLLPKKRIPVMSTCNCHPPKSRAQVAWNRVRHA